MTFSFSITAKSHPNRLKTPSDAAAVPPPINYVSEFCSDESPPPEESKIKPIAPVPDACRPNKRLKNLPNRPPISQPIAEDDEADQSNPESADASTGYGLNFRAAATSFAPIGNYETISDMEWRILREDLVNLPDGPGLDDFEDVPVEGFGAALLSGYGWKEGRGVGRNSKGDVRIYEITMKRNRWGIGFNKAKKRLKEKDMKEVMIVKGRGMGMKCKILGVRNGGDVLVVRVSKSNEKVKVRRRDVAAVGSVREEKCMRKLKELRVKESHMGRDKSVGNLERVDWLRSHIRVRIVSQQLKGGALFFKKGVVIDVVGPGVCDICVDESGELVQGVDQDLLEAVIPKRGCHVLVLCGRHEGVYGTLLGRDSEKETGLVRDGDTQELLIVKLVQVAEYTGDPSDIGY